MKHYYEIFSEKKHPILMTNNTEFSSELFDEMISEAKKSLITTKKSGNLDTGIVQYLIENYEFSLIKFTAKS